MAVSARALPFGQGGSGGAQPTRNQRSAKLADGLLDDVYTCLRRIITAEETPRNARYALQACELVIEAADGLVPEQPIAAPVRLVDAKAAAEELRRRLQGERP